jgi:hypothetical protein
MLGLRPLIGGGKVGPAISREAEKRIPASRRSGIAAVKQDTRPQPPAPRWGIPLAGTLFILAGCCQVAYATAAIVAALGVALLEILFILVRALFSISNESRPRDISPTESGSAIMDAAMPIGSVGFGLALVAIVAGILVLRNNRLARYAIVLFVILCVVLAAQHLLIPLYAPALIYGILAVLSTVLLLLWWRSFGVGEVRSSTEKKAAT